MDSMNEAGPKDEAVFEAALQLPAGERAAYLDKACAGDGELRRRVEGLLGAFERAGGFLKEPAVPLPPRTSPLTLPPTEKPGDRIGRYKLLEQIGEGGCGVVYVAEQGEPVRRRVALKIIKLGMDTKQVIGRFEAERQALALMDHPNIAKVLDAGATETGRPYFVMELVRGIKITEFCDQSKLTTVERLHLFIQVCQAIQHAHQKGIIHRDIKPSNILVTLNEPGSPGVPKVIDFGIAKATQGRLTDYTIYTAFEQFLGTPAYMSPEQAVMTSLDIDTRSDIYSLGVLLYELLTGKTPFEQKELLAAGLDEMRRTIREKEPVKPSTRLTQDLASTSSRQQLEIVRLVRGDLDWIVMKCLEKDRSRRYSTANGLAADIQRHLSDEPVVARPPSKLYEFQKTVRRHKFGFAACAAIIGVLLVGVFVSAREAARAWRAEWEQIRLREAADLEKQKAQREANKSWQVAQFLKDMLNSVEPRTAQAYDTVLLRRILDNTAQRVDTDLKDQPEVEAELLEIIGRVYFETGPVDKAEEVLRKGLALTKDLPGDHRALTGQFHHDLGLVLWRQNRNAEAESEIRGAVAIFRTVPGAGNRSLLGVLTALGGVLIAEGKPDQAEATEMEVLRLVQNPDGEEATWALDFLGQALEAQGKYSQAEPALRKAIAIRENVGATNTFDYASSLQFLGEMFMHEDRLREAEICLRQAVTVHRRVSDPHRNPSLSWTLGSLATVLDQQTNYAAAEDSLREAWLIQQTVLGEEHPNTIGMRIHLISVLQEEGKTNEANALLEAGTNSAPEKKTELR
jgi:tetratricopeptide (TPR) repeat protein